MFTEAQNLDIVRVALNAVFYQEFNYLDSNPRFTDCKNDKLFKQMPFTMAQYISEVYKGSGLFPIIGETQAVPSAVPQVTNKYTASVLDFAQSIYPSKDLFDDNMHNVWAETVRDFGESARISQDAFQFGVFRNAFTTQLTADGVPMINANHPLIGGGIQSNQVSGALSHTTINNAIINLAQQKNQAGIIKGQQPSVLLVPPALIDLAIQETDSALYADTANNAINVFRSAYGFLVVSNPYIGAAYPGGSDTAWFMLARNHAIKRVIRQGLETALVNWQYSDNRTYKYTANFRETNATEDYIGIVASLGY